MTKKPKVELLISTMDKKDITDVQALHIQTEAVVVNQCDRDGCWEKETDGHHICWVDSSERGLSKSRNTALDAARGDIVVLCDDDEEFVDDYQHIIFEAFEKHPRADLIAFQVEGIEREFKSYPQQGKKLNYLSSLSVSSVEIALRRESVTGKHIRFREEFGSGAKYKMGEENIFLYDCLKNGLKIYYEPQSIARLHMGDSSWFNGFDEKYFLDRGAVYYELFGSVWGKMMLVVFAAKNYRRFKSEMPLAPALKQMFEGFKERKQFTKD